MSEYVPNTSLIRVCDRRYQQIAKRTVRSLMYVCEVTYVYDDVTCVYRGYQQIANGLCEACNPGKLGGQVCVCLNPLPKPQA